jgi:hypothetical protein
MEKSGCDVKEAISQSDLPETQADIACELGVRAASEPSDLTKNLGLSGISHLQALCGTMLASQRRATVSLRSFQLFRNSMGGETGDEEN